MDYDTGLTEATYAINGSTFPVEEGIVIFKNS